ncbi:rhodanese-like domain-containing protein [Algoriphagus halophytocola]|uniref:Rhodanese-like domain-containing protein n=1 Tax=Algoriphagus halophytocola TaxID=2991499 RepID=A0ABY6MFX4_9BACT|nr:MULTISPECIES: rhodanese-like domain-containing protein [unclassified Algoriphagus]UZD22715.1 rhodanese-like domain-containing protein [Algoriphagus sp. TR-M5]WBL43980.1 rhodanese-like domain-containing protein [Algoriphagus sp. TR-M9]
MRQASKKIQLYLFFFLLLFIFENQVQAQSVAYKALLATLYDSEFPVLKPAELTDLSSYQVVDTREKEEFEVSHLQHAIWAGYDTFSMENVAELDKNQPVLVYCTVGARSQEIGKKLKEEGFKKVYNLYGGLIEWANEEKPIYHGDSLTNQVHTYSRSWGIWLTKGEKVY